jgi:hypothetical protein
MKADGLNQVLAWWNHVMFPCSMVVCLRKRTNAFKPEACVSHAGSARISHAERSHSRFAAKLKKNVSKLAEPIEKHS